MTDTQNQKPKTWLQKGNRKAIAIFTGTMIAVGGAFGVQAFADSKTYSHMKVFASEKGNWHRAGWGGGHRQRLSEMSDAEIEAKVERIVKHVAIEIDATEDQQKKITTLVTAVARDLKPLRGQMREAGQEMHRLLLSDTIDRAAFERIRAERLAEVDRISKSLVDAAADVAEVLTAEQRKVLNERIKEFRSMRKGWHRG